MAPGPLRWRVRDRLTELPAPCVMGVLNATPDSFHAGSRIGMDQVLRTAERMLTEGAAILDIGGVSTRPGSDAVPTDEEMRRTLPVTEAVHARFPEVLLSVDTWRAAVAEAAVSAGAGMVNDIGAGLLDPGMLAAVAALHVPYVAMHMQGRPATMQVAPSYRDAASEVTLFLSERLEACRAAGIPDVVLDPGFGFGKSTEHNFTLLRELPRTVALGAPVLVGLSRKRMLKQVLGTDPADALNGTTVLNTLALMKGASILRVHDVREAVEAVKLVERFGGTP